MDGLPEAQIRAALEELLGWPAIARSPQLARFLSYIVTARLRGEEANIKAYAVAVDVFGRPPSFDPQTDPIVRVQARRLRALLDQFYEEGRGKAGVRIDLPVGRYVPEFRALDTGPGEPADEPVAEPAAATAAQAAERSTPAGRARWPWLALAAIAIVVAVLALAYVMQRQEAPPAVATASETATEPAAPPPPDWPLLLVGEFTSEGNNLLAARVTEALEVTFRPFEDLRIGTATGTPAPQDAGAYRLEGQVDAGLDRITLAAVLRSAEGEEVWRGTFSRPLGAGSGAASAIEGLARSVVRELAPFRGPLHAEGRRWLDAQQRPLTAVNAYVCLLTYRFARESGSSRHVADALACYDQLLSEQADLPVAVSANAWLETLAIVSVGEAAAQDAVTAIAAPLAAARRAVELAPQSSLVHEHLGAILNRQGAFSDSEREFVEALRLNPLNADARAGYAVVLGRDTDFVLSRQQGDLALADTPYPSPWYFYPRAIDAFRNGQFDLAIEAGRRASGYGGGEMGRLIALAAAAQADRRDVVDELLPQATSSEALRRAGIRAWLDVQLPEMPVVDAIVAGLLRAGVPERAVTGPF